MVTLELAACLPALVVIVAALVGLLAVGAGEVRVQDAAREAARAAARGDAAEGVTLAGAQAPGARVALSTSGDVVIARTSLEVHLLVSWLPPVLVRASAVAALEPGVTP
jgi:hypothetical protein